MPPPTPLTTEPTRIRTRNHTRIRSWRWQVTAGTVLALALAGVPTPLRAFEVFRHSSLTSEVLTRQGVAGNALSFILQGVRWPDLSQCISGCYCPAYLQIFCSDPDSNQVRQFSVSHFDNNMLFESRENVDLLMTLARSGLSRGTPPATAAERRSVGVALMFFGEALHAIQDFYAHATWVELNRDLVRIGGHIYSAPLWNGEQLGGSVNVGGTTISGTQTGFVDLPVPPGSVTHALLNKDSPGSAQGQIVVNRLFPPGPIGTYYQIASGHVNGVYTDDGLASRHTIKAWQCLLADCAIYDLPTSPAVEPAARRAPITHMTISELLAWVNADPEMAVSAQRIDSVWTASNPDTPSTYPIALFDADGWPLPVTLSAEDLFTPVARVLEGGRPNPFRGRTAIRFYAPRHGHVQLDVFDLSGRRVHTLIDQEVDPGWKEAWWSGHDASGAALASGQYVCRLRGFGRDESCRVSLVH